MSISKSSEPSATSYCGFVAIIGRPNVGKSTLLNGLLGQKISITSQKPQTTRHRILGVKTENARQIVYVDTPGIHASEVHLLNKEMNKAARGALVDVDLVLFVVDGLKWTPEDTLALKSLQKIKCPVFLIVNKIDTIKNKKELLPHLRMLSQKRDFAEIIPLSAKRGDQLAVLEQKISEKIPENPHFFAADQITDKSSRFMTAEIIREKLTRLLGQEIPYALTVEIEQFEASEHYHRIGAIIWVEREGQKPIVVGKGGERLKEIGIRARQDLEQLLKTRVHLSLWVKVKSGWSDDTRALQSLGYLDLE